MTSAFPSRRHVLAGGMGLSLAAMTGCASGPGRAMRGVDSGSPVATVAGGELQGRRAGDVLSFLGVPYALDPYAAARRFRAPEPVPAWTGVRPATAYGPMPPQPSRKPGGGLAGAVGDLTLNIWAPANAHRAPVLVWIPGGAYYRVDASEGWYDGSGFARRGIVVVAINYRVGIDGFLAVEGMPPNRGLLDQVAALKWVQENIASFGGDPGRVTLAGQSAGGQSVMLLMGMPAAQGLFQRAIAQSPPVKHLLPEQTPRITEATAAFLKVEPTAAALAAVSLRSVPPKGAARQRAGGAGPVAVAGLARLHAERVAPGRHGERP